MRRLIGSGILAEIPRYLTHHGFGKKLMLVFDDYTWLAAGKEVAQHLEATEFEIITYSLGREVKATFQNAEILGIAATDMDGLIAVGSGTINDLVKYAAAQIQKPYLCVATACSMNGYSSANTSLERDGAKHSYPATPPCAVLADLQVLAGAPKRMSRAGFGDTLCRSSVETDMMLSHFLLGTPYPRELFDRLRRHEPALIAQASQLTAKDKFHTSLHALLFEALLDAGDAMTEFGSSAVASQGEHMIAHTATLMYGSELTHVLHGEMIAVATLTCGQLQQQMLLGTPVVKPLPRASSLFLRVFGKYSADMLDRQYQKKLLTAEQAVAINEIIARDWPQIKQSIQDVMLPPTTLKRALVIGGISTVATDLRLDVERYRSAVTYAHMARDRFTFLDLAAMNDKRV